MKLVGEARGSWIRIRIRNRRAMWIVGVVRIRQEFGQEFSGREVVDFVRRGEEGGRGEGQGCRN